MPNEAKKIKCVIWDLDCTLWDGILLEDGTVTIQKETIAIIKELDRRGILNSIASKNDYDEAMAVIKKAHMEEYFLVPQISFGAKSEAVSQIAKLLNLGTDTFAFIDDQAYEREEVAFTHPNVLCIDSAEINQILDWDRFNPDFITEDSGRRREMYQQNLMRQKMEEEYQGPMQEFLQSLHMVCHVKAATDCDLQRAEELVLRTNQLNSTGIMYGYEELSAYAKNPNYRLLVCDLEDKFGSYGKVGLTLLKEEENTYDIKLLLFSCRVMSRGIGNAFLSYLILKAKENHKQLIADFVETGKNKMMYITYKMAGFQEISVLEKQRVLAYAGDYSCTIPDYLTISEEKQVETII